MIAKWNGNPQRRFKRVVTPAVVWAIRFAVASAVIAANEASAQEPRPANVAPQIAPNLIPPERATVWSPGLNAVGGIPNRTTVCAKVDASRFGDGSIDATWTIQAAINSCPAGQIVQLSAGHFQVNDLILINKGITLRGAGPKATLLSKSNGAVAGVDHGETNAQPIIIVGPSRWPKINNATSQALTADGEKGSRSIRLADTRGFAAGQFVLLDANEYDAATWIDLPPRNGVPTVVKIFASDRVVFMRHNPPAPGTDDEFPRTLTWFSREGRPVAEVKEIASVSGDVITFTTPIHITFPVSKSSQLTRYVDAHVKHAGIEDLAVSRGSDGAIRFEVAAYSWMRNVENSVWGGEGIAINSSFRIEVRDSFIHDAAFSTPGGGAYAISLALGSSDCLIENNIILKANKVIVARSSGAGSVVAYNYADDGLIEYQPTWHEVGISGSHAAGSHMMLFEGNQSFNYDSDNTHGNAIYMTVFRNHLTGFRRNYPGTANARAAGLNYGSWWHSFVGNVLGVSGKMSGWTYENVGQGRNKTSPFDGPLAIWKLGYQSGQWDQSADPRVLSTVLRQGNFDFVTEQVRWDGEAQEIPNSLYLTAKPAFFGSNVWPWVEPAGSTKLFTLPARARYDAGTPFAPPPQ